MVFSAVSHSQELIVGFGKNKAPFVIEESGQGLEIDIFREALAYKGHTLSVVHVDNKGLLNLLSSGRVDAVATARDSQNHYCAIDKFIEFENVAISFKDANLKLKTADDLKPYIIVAWENAYQDLGPEFHELFKPNANNDLPKGYFEHRNQEAQNTMFWAGRVDVIVVDTTIFAWHRKQLSSQLPIDRPVVYHRIFGEKTYFPALFKDEKLCDDFSAGLANLKAEKRYRQLYQKYSH